MAEPPKDATEFEPVLRRAWETGCRRWPQVDLPADVFIRHLLRLLPEDSDEGSLELQIMPLDVEGLYLACACVNHVPGALEMLERNYLAKLPALLGYLKLSAAVLDEVCQRVRTHLLVRTPKAGFRLAEYTGRGALLIWMRVIAVRMAIQQGIATRETSDERALAALEAVPASGTDAELEFIKRRYGHEFRQAVGEAFAALSSDRRYLLRLYFIDRLPMTKIGPLFGKDQSTISRWLKEAREGVYDDTKRRLQERLRLSSHEFESLMDAIKSRFEMSMSQLLKEEKEKDEEN
ncbi:sigma-70 family RNA polymerase sigma factor [Hyalangium sp.]|uniref:sigma-70 family RNA polymerase sigma factor n=1 Tax=Hyalangium sp. TaxID=2028555 RepID=UPI002D629B5B|nr:sigma-70 family RNA polymerase sigma factor [Hyalangium sp.]HYH95476.1 sigma-70 family RNA polymerase sigma factor [Hyalangium sp.]